MQYKTYKAFKKYYLDFAIKESNSDKQIKFFQIDKLVVYLG
jgi:hypothetical protein